MNSFIKTYPEKSMGNLYKCCIIPIIQDSQEYRFKIRYLLINYVTFILFR